MNILNKRNEKMKLIYPLIIIGIGVLIAFIDSLVEYIHNMHYYLYNFDILNTFLDFLIPVILISLSLLSLKQNRIELLILLFIFLLIEIFKYSFINAVFVMRNFFLIISVGFLILMLRGVFKNEAIFVFKIFIAASLFLAFVGSRIVAITDFFFYDFKLLIWRYFIYSIRDFILFIGITYLLFIYDLNKEIKKLNVGYYFISFFNLVFLFVTMGLGIYLFNEGLLRILQLIGIAAGSILISYNKNKVAYIFSLITYIVMIILTFILKVNIDYFFGFYAIITGVLMYFILLIFDKHKEKEIINYLNK